MFRLAQNRPQNISGNHRTNRIDRTDRKDRTDRTSKIMIKC
jgi:hypothetical protein